MKSSENPRKKNEFMIDETSLHGQRAIENAAVIAHEANRYYCLAIGDNSQPTWANAPDWQKSSALNGVRQILENPRVTPEECHESWMKQKAVEGWVYGEVKDPEKKTHPCMVPYDQLPDDQRRKDAIFRASVRAALYEYGGRRMRPAKRNLGDCEIQVTTDVPLYDHGLAVTLGRANRIAQMTIKAFLDTTGYPVLMDLADNDEIFNMTLFCAANRNVQRAFDAFRANKFPIVIMDMPSHDYIKETTDPVYSKAFLRSRVMWHLMFGITKAVMWIDGVTYRPEGRWAAAIEKLLAFEDAADAVADVISETR